MMKILPETGVSLSFMGSHRIWYLLFTHCSPLVVSLEEGLSEMENLIEGNLLSKENSNAKGGFRTLPFIIGNT